MLLCNHFEALKNKTKNKPTQSHEECNKAAAEFFSVVIVPLQCWLRVDQSWSNILYLSSPRQYKMPPRLMWRATPLLRGVSVFIFSRGIAPHCGTSHLVNCEGCRPIGFIGWNASLGAGGVCWVWSYEGRLTAVRATDRLSVMKLFPSTIFCFLISSFNVNLNVGEKSRKAWPLGTSAANS